MRMSWVVLSLAATAVFAAEPRALSVHPFTGQRGANVLITVRGNALRDATSVFADKAALVFAIEGAETEPATTASTRAKASFDLVRLSARIAENAMPGNYSFRMVTPGGISNALAFQISEDAVIAEPEGSHETPGEAIEVDRVPALFTGRIARRGESDFYAISAKEGETFTFQAISGLPSIGAPGGNASGFDPSLSIFEESPSWFDPKRLKRLAFNDEPLWAIGNETDAHLVHKFATSGRYFLRVEAFSGQGGPDYSYQLKILPGAHAQDVTHLKEGWSERGFQRQLSSNRLNELAARGGKKQDQKSIETYRAATEPTLFKIPGTLEGGIAHPGEAQGARFHIDGPQDIAIEVETPETAPPLFNPIVRLLDEKGEEVATNIFVGKGACTGAMSKSIQAKTIIPLRNPGDYTVEVRDTTADLGEPGFRYRVQVRPQIAHVGQVKIAEDHINIAPGEAKSVRVVFDREEDFRGAVAVVAESLPPGVQALAGADYEPDKDPPPFPGKRERYTPRTERTVVIFTASPDAALTKQPHVARLVVRPVADGKPGDVLVAKEIPMMVVGQP